MTITQADAEDTAAALARAANDVEVRQLRAQLNAQSREWQRAASDLGDLTVVDLDTGEREVAGAIELAGSVCTGMRVFRPSAFGGDDPYAYVVRNMGARDGQLSLHLEVEGRPEYMNLVGPASPVVVER